MTGKCELARTFTWRRYGGYECSSRGDKRFSALYARLPDGRTIEEAYQLDVKGYRAFSNDWRCGKGKLPRGLWPGGTLWLAYLDLWRTWADYNPTLMLELREHGARAGYVLSDRFAKTDVSQARALALLLNEGFG